MYERSQFEAPKFIQLQYTLDPIIGAAQEPGDGFRPVVPRAYEASLTSFALN